MTRSSPGVKRMAAVLDFMADHPGQAFALTDLVRALKLSRATCHAMLTGLVEVGYLYRTADKTYVLGPALMRIARRTEEHFSPLRVAQSEMRALADAYDVVCSAILREGDTAVVRERAASVSHVGYSVPLGTRVKLSTPRVAAFLAWSPAEAEEWLANSAPAPTPDERETMLAGMAFAREHGFLAMVRNPLAPPLNRVPEAFSMPDSAEMPVVLTTAIIPGENYEATSITAPVFNDKGRVEFVLGLMGFNRVMSGAELLHVAGELRAACGRISGFLAGKIAPQA